MNVTWATAIRRQLGAAIDMLENALRTCPEALWTARLWNERRERAEAAEFWYIAYHTLFWLDLYLSGSAQGFAPPAPFTLDEMDPAGLLPERRYTRDEICEYLDHCRRKCRTVMDALTDERARQRCQFPWGAVSYAELLLDNMRHVQEHAAQLNLLLGQQIGSASTWITQAKHDDSRTPT